MHLSVFDFMSDLQQRLLTLLAAQITKHTTIKVNVELFGLFELESKGIEDVKSFNTKNEILTAGSSLSEYYDHICQTLHRKISEFQERDSGKLSLNPFGRLFSYIYALF